MFSPENTENFVYIDNADTIDYTHNQTSMFVNKYSEDPNLPTVANKLAKMITRFEINQKVQIEEENDFEVDEEVVTEETYVTESEEYMSQIKIDVRLCIITSGSSTSWR